MSRKNVRQSEDAQREWLERRDREREEARKKAEEQVKVPAGYRRIQLEEE